MKWFAAMMVVIFLFAGCDNEKSVNDNDETNDQDQIEEIETHELIGRYSDSWGGGHIISNTVWDQGGMMGRFNIELFDSENDVIIAQNDKNNEFSAEKWSRFD